MRKLMALFVVFLLIFLFTAGCIDIYIVKDWLVPHEEERIDYQITEYIFSDSFNSTQSNPLETYNEEFKVPVKPLTKHMRFDINVEMRSAHEAWETINDSLPEDFPGRDYLEQMAEMLLQYADQRYVEITIKSPDGEEWFNYRFNDTESVEFPPETPLQGPGEGEWTIGVEAAGGGIKITDELAYYDSFSILVVIYEPKE